MLIVLIICAVIVVAAFILGLFEDKELEERRAEAEFRRIEDKKNYCSNDYAYEKYCLIKNLDYYCYRRR